MEHFSTRRTLCASIGSMWTVLRQSPFMDLMMILELLSKGMVWLELLLLHLEDMLLHHQQLHLHHQEDMLHHHQQLLFQQDMHLLLLILL